MSRCSLMWPWIWKSPYQVLMMSPDSGNIINTWYGDFQIQGHISEHLDMWTKVQAAQWWNGSGGPGADSRSEERRVGKECRSRWEGAVQAEDGIRDGHVTGVQTCALPILWPWIWKSPYQVLMMSPDSGNIINTWYGDFQIQGHISEHLDMWTKVQAAQWWNGSGGPGADS